MTGTQFMRYENDPFRLYQSYLEICKPLDYETSLHNLEGQNEKLKSMLEVEKVRADTIQSACERYLKEEAELKRKFHKMRSDLEEEKQKRQEDVERLTEEIVTCKTKRKEESNAA